MRSVSFSMNVSLDGYIAAPDGDINWSAPDPEVFRSHIDEVRGVGAYLLGRRLYETMLYWETAKADPSLDPAQREWADLWTALPKVVFSRTLGAVVGNARLAEGDLAAEIARLRSEPGEGRIAVGGAMLAAQAAEADLIDEYRVRLSPVLLGAGVPFFPRGGHRVDLELVESRTIGAQTAYLRYRVVRDPR